ncbi:MAG: nuclear transport factor 2 family protein [Steroidobacteraceae bacterium]
MTLHSSPTEIVNRQLSAYNSRDIDAYCALFSRDAVLSKLDTGEEFVRGIEALRAYYTTRFSNPALHCRIVNRVEIGNFVIDHEEVAGVRDGLLRVVAIYEVRDSLIRTVRFIWP